MQYLFDHVHFISQDVEAAEAFFHSMFGAKTVHKGELYGAANLVMDLHGQTLRFRGRRQGEEINGDGADLRYGADHIGFAVTSLDDAVQELTAKGAVFTRPPTHTPSGLYIAFVQGPDQMRIELTQC
jgi:catechol 2,3-dioxygenase-like lactoylglutathione lyase family enzyme